jgi:malate dehydrogenase (oxaloacetate-decarboxylating)(NADP+)
MYKVMFEDGEIVIRFKEDMITGDTLSRLLDSVNLESVLNRSRLLGSKKSVHSGLPTGIALLKDPALNKGTAFTEKEREALGLRGLLPPHVQTQAEQVTRVLENLRRKTSAIEKYIFLISLQDRNKTLFYRVLIR